MWQCKTYFLLHWVCILLLANKSFYSLTLKIRRYDFLRKTCAVNCPRDLSGDSNTGCSTAFHPPLGSLRLEKSTLGCVCFPDSETVQAVGTYREHKEINFQMMSFLKLIYWRQDLRSTRQGVTQVLLSHFPFHSHSFLVSSRMSNKGTIRNMEVR